MNLNIAYLIGLLTRDPEIKYTPSGKLVANIGLATHSFSVDKETNEKKDHTEFHNIVCFGKLAEISQKYLKKGSLAMFSGKIRTRDWDDKNGLKHYRTEIIADNMQLGPKLEGSEKITEESPF